MLNIHWFKNFFKTTYQSLFSQYFICPHLGILHALFTHLVWSMFVKLYFVFKTNTLKIEKSCKKVLDLQQHKYLYYYISIWITYTKHKYVNSFNIIHYNWNYTHLTNRSCPVLQKACNRIPTKHKKV